MLIALAADVDDLAEVRRYGVHGQAQHGIDAVGFSRTGGQAYAYQAKRVQSFTKNDLATAIAVFAGGRRPFDARRLVIAVATDANRTEVVEGLAAARREHADLTIELWDAGRINDLLRSRPPIVCVFFGDEVAQRFCLGGRLPGRVPDRRRRRKWPVLVAIASVVVLLATIATVALTSGEGWFYSPWAAPTESQPGSDSDVPSSDAPLTVAVREDTPVCGTDWVVPRPLAQIDMSIAPDRTSEIGWKDWPPGAGGVTASPSYVYLTVQGVGDAQVVITDLRVRVLDPRKPPLPGTSFSAQCGDTGVLRFLTADLDYDPPKIDSEYYESEDTPPQERAPIAFPYEVSLSDAETFLIVATTEECDCSWAIELSWASQGQTDTLYIDDHGAPFRTTSTTNAQECVVSGGISCY